MKPRPPTTDPRPVLLSAPAALSPGDPALAPASLLLLPTAGGGRLLAVGHPDDLRRLPEAADARRLHLPGAVLLPALVNAHAHLDLTAVGPRPYDHAGGFPAWASLVMRSRPADPDALRAAVRLGVERSIAGGVAAVGDIAGAGSLAPLLELRDSPLWGVSFVELFGQGPRQSAAAQRARDLIANDVPHPRVRLGLSPHAPYSAGPDLYAAAVATGAPIATHLAEMPEERRYIAAGDGPFLEYAQRLGVWHDDIRRDVGRGLHPIAYLLPRLGDAPALLAHVNDCPDDALALLARARCSVAWCPRAHEYFRRRDELGPHRWRDMLDAGVNVCLGTDSVINLPPQHADRISTLDDARLLYGRDGADPAALLDMLTVRGARALGLPPDLFRLRPGPVAGLIAVDVADDAPADPLRAVFAARGAPRPLVIGARWLLG